MGWARVEKCDILRSGHGRFYHTKCFLLMLDMYFLLFLASAGGSYPAGHSVCEKIGDVV